MPSEVLAENLSHSSLAVGITRTCFGPMTFTEDYRVHYANTSLHGKATKRRTFINNASIPLTTVHSAVLYNKDGIKEEVQTSGQTESIKADVEVSMPQTCIPV